MTADRTMGLIVGGIFQTLAIVFFYFAWRCGNVKPIPGTFYSGIGGTVYMVGQDGKPKPVEFTAQEKK